jgi:hypothetical protein
MLGRLGAITSGGHPVKRAVRGKLYRVRLALWKRENGRWVRTGTTLPASFRVR